MDGNKYQCKGCALASAAVRDDMDSLVARQEDAPFLGGVSKELRVVVLLPEQVNRPGHLPAPLAQGLDQWAAEVVVREERKARHYRPEWPFRCRARSRSI